MGFLKRQKSRFDLIRQGTELGRADERDRPATEAGLSAQMEQRFAHQEELAAYAERHARMISVGVVTPATLRGAQFEAERFAVLATLDWTIEPIGGSAYEARCVDRITLDASSLVPGAKGFVLVDPDEPQAVMSYLWGPRAEGFVRAGTVPSPPVAPPGPAVSLPPAVSDWVATQRSKDSPVDRIEKLAELRSQGLISDEEFETRKAEILGSS